jgi:hypothetical protein
MTNLLIAYDLIAPGKNYERVQNAIRALGPWYKLQYSLYYVKSSLTASEAHRAVRLAMDANDKLCVIDALNVVTNGYPPNEFGQLQSVWAQAA